MQLLTTSLYYSDIMRKDTTVSVNRSTKQMIKNYKLITGAKSADQVINRALQHWLHRATCPQWQVTLQYGEPLQKRLNEVNTNKTLKAQSN